MKCRIERMTSAAGRRSLAALTVMTWCAAILPAADWRSFTEGRAIPDESCCDQPYIIRTRDGAWLCTMTTGPGTESKPGQHVVFIVDGGPKMVSVTVDGRLCDGGAERAYGYGRFVTAAKAGAASQLADVSGGADLRLAPEFGGEISVVRIYDRALRTTEAIGNFRATRKAH